MPNKQIADELKKLLADTYAIFLKTQNYHWNVEGPNFMPIHGLLEEQYDDLFEAIDVIAELIRGLGYKSPGSFEDFAKLTSIKSGDENANATKMLKDLTQDNENIQKTLMDIFNVAGDAGDEVVAGYMAERMTVHRKAAWKLRSSL